MDEIIHDTGMKGPGYQSRTEEIQKTALGMGLTSLNDNAGHGDLIGMPKEFSDFTNLFAVKYASIKDDLKARAGREISLEEYLTYLDTQGEFDNKMDKPLQELISAILDVTIIKPLIEMCTGYDMITGEDLTDFERGLKGVFAVVDVVTLFIGIKASGVAREALKTGGRIIATDLISNGTAYAVGKMGEELGLPLPITLMLSLGAGVTVSLTAGKYVFKDSAGNVVLEAGADEVDEIRTQIKRQAQNGSDALEGGSYASPNKVDSLLDGRPELTGSTRDKLLATVQDPELSKIVNELYRPGATVGDGGTAAILVEEFSKGSSTHLLKATERLKQLKKLASSGKLGLNDLDVVEALIDDLESAISLYN